MSRAISSDVLAYRAAVPALLEMGTRVRSFNLDQQRRFVCEAFEVGERPAAFTDLSDGAWHLTAGRYRGALISSKIPGKRIPFGVDGGTVLLLNVACKVRTGYEKGGEQMARSISVNEILKQAEAAQKAYEAAVEQRKNVRKVARTLAEAGLLDEEDVAKVEEIFPARKAKDADAAEGEGEE